MKIRPDIINRENASSHKLTPGRIYSGQVKAVDASGKVSVFIGELGCSYGDIVPLNTTPNTKCAVGDIVKCVFTDEFFTDIVILGSARIGTDRYPTMAQYTEIVSDVSEIMTFIDSGGAQGPQGAAGAEGGTTTLTTKGDILTRTSSTVARLGVGAENFVLMARPGQAEGIQWTSVPSAPMRSGRWHGVFGRGAGAGFQSVNGRVGLQAMYLARQRTLDAVAVRIGTSGTGSTGSVCRIGLWASDADGWPSDLVQDFGSVDTTVATGTVLQISSINLPIGPGQYFIGAATQGTPATLPFMVGVDVVGAAGVGGQALQFGSTGANAATTDFDSLAFFLLTGATGAFGSASGASPNTIPPIKVIWRFSA